MHYLSRFTETSSGRLRAIVDTHWNAIENWIHLIASACYPFPEVMKALSEPMCVFPIEGLPGNRYFPGTQVMDTIENSAEELLRQLFSLGEEYGATIQPHSGTQANQIVFNAVLRPSDKVLSLSPSDGGHISHKVLIGRRNPVIFYPLAQDGLIDFNALEQLASIERPRLIVAGGSAYPREIDFSGIGDVAKKNGAFFHADISHTATFVATGVHRSVFPKADFVTFNMVKNLRGPNGGVLLYRSEEKDRVRRALFPDTQGGPNENTMFAKLVALEKLTEFDLRSYAERMVTIARRIAAVLIDRGYDVVTNGTDSHQILVDLRSKKITGMEVEKRFERSRVLINRNLVARDNETAYIASGIRMGSACLAILDYSDEDVDRLSDWLADRIEGDSSDLDLALIDELTGKYNKQLMPFDPLVSPMR